MKNHALAFAFLISSCTGLWAQAFFVPNTGNNVARELSCECYQLTPDTSFLLGAIWYRNQVDLSNPFDFTFKIFPGADNGGADGMAFIIQDQGQNQPPAGSVGSQLGYETFPGRSMSIEYDLYDNGAGAPYDDIPQQHIAIDTGGLEFPAAAGPVPALPSGANIDDGNWHTTEIVWQPATQVLNIYFDGNLRISYTFTGGLVNTVFGGQNLLYWGWTGTCGGARDLKKVCIPLEANFTSGNHFANCGLDSVNFADTSVSGLNNIVSYAWNFGDGSTSTLASPSHTFLSSGVFNVNLSITDGGTCTSDTTIPVGVYSIPVLTPIQTNVTCFNDGNGSVNVAVSNGTLPFTYHWNPQISTTGSASFLTPGNYALVVTDSAGCSASATYTITQPQPLNDSLVEVNILCAGNTTGSISNFVTGGTPAYTYTWNPNVSSGSSANNIPAGTYNITVTDLNGCSVVQSATITPPPPLTISGTSNKILCFGNMTGSVTVAVAGGTPGYNYIWNPNVSASDSAMNLDAGTYNITATDANGCTIAETEIVTGPASALSISTTATPVLCFDQSTGTIDVTASGGTPGYNYSAFTGTTQLSSATGQFSQLGPATYTVLVTDQNLCADSALVTVNSPPQLFDSIGAVSPTCYDYTNGEVVVAASGGTPGYTFTLPNSPANATGIFNKLGAGVYVVTVTDSSGCTLADSTTLTQPDSVLIEVTPDPVQVKLGQSLQINSTTNQTDSVFYAWSPDFGLSCYDCADPVYTGVYSQPYTVTATNAAGCVGTYVVDVTVVPVYDIFFPNAFSPGSGGTNDTWQIFGNLDAVKQVQVMVFDRIGEKVFESDNIDFKWDGSYKGKQAPQGVYTYTGKVVWINDYTEKRFTGSITLLR